MPEQEAYFPVSGHCRFFVVLSGPEAYSLVRKHTDMSVDQRSRYSVGDIPISFRNCLVK